MTCPFSNWIFVLFIQSNNYYGKVSNFRFAYSKFMNFFLLHSIHYWFHLLFGLHAVLLLDACCSLSVFVHFNTCSANTGVNSGETFPQKRAAKFSHHSLLPICHHVIDMNIWKKTFRKLNSIEEFRFLITTFLFKIYILSKVCIELSLEQNFYSYTNSQWYTDSCSP